MSSPLRPNESGSKDHQESLLPQEKKPLDKPLICFCVLNFFLNAGVSVIAPFYPPKAKEAGVSMSMIGYIFSFNPIGAFFFSLILGKYMAKWGRKRCMIAGLFLQSLAITCFGFLDLMTDYYGLFVTFSFASRFLQGASRAAYSSISFAYVPILWPTTIQQKISLLESLTGLGMMSGPFLGAGLDYFMNYQSVFYVMGGLFALAIIPTITSLPEDHHEIKSEHKLDMKKIGGSRWVLSLGLLLTMMSAGTTFINPLFSIHMESYDFSANQSSLMLGWLTVSYVLFINFVPKICKVVDKKIVLTVGLMFSAVGDLVIAPITIFPNEWYMKMFGLPLIGIANALCVLPSIPQFIEYITIITDNPLLKNAISDLSSGLFIAYYSLGNLVGPVLGGVVYDAFLQGSKDVDDEMRSFRWASQVIALLQFISAIIFFFAGDAYKALSNKRIVEPVSLNQSLQQIDDAETADETSKEPLLETQYDALQNEDTVQQKHKEYQQPEL